jgi:hypothetical protein
MTAVAALPPAAGIAAPAGEPAGRGRPLTGGERRAVVTVAVLVLALGVIGFANSFTAVAHAARPAFGVLAPTVPLGIDLGIAIFAALDITLARLDLRPRWVPAVPWALTAATVWLNIAGQHTWFARVAHAVLPALWIAAVSVTAHVVRVRAGLAAGTAMDRIRPSRWLLAPVPTARLMRRMVLWEIRSYPDALRRERDRLLALTELQDSYGRLAWRWRAPRRTRALYRLGELAPARTADAPGEPVSCPWPRPAPALPAAPGRARTRDRTAPRSRTRGAPRTASAPRTRTRTPPQSVTAPAAVRHFAADLAEGRVPSARRIKAELRVGQDHAARIRAHLVAVATAPTRQPDPAPSGRTA